MSWFSILKISTEDAIRDTQRFTPELIEEGERLNQDEKVRAWKKFKPKAKRIVDIFKEWLNNNPEDAVKDKDEYGNREEKWKKIRNKVSDFVNMRLMDFSNLEDFHYHLFPVYSIFSDDQHWPFKKTLDLSGDKLWTVENIMGNSGFELSWKPLRWADIFSSRDWKGVDRVAEGYRPERSPYGYPRR